MKLNREDARKYIIEHGTELLTPDGSKKGFVCPICGSGSGKKGTGITSKDKNHHFTCWAGCFVNADIIDIWGQLNGVTDYGQKLKLIAPEFGIEIESGYVNLSSPSAAADFGNVDQEQPEEKKTDFTPFFLQAHDNLDKTDYWKERGLSRETADRFMLGYCEAWTHPKAPNAPSTPRLIVPISKYSYLARDTRAEIPEEQDKYKKPKVKGENRPIWIFNHKALEAAAQPIFVVEGEIDAMSIVEAGGEAVALGSIAYVSAFLDLVSQKRPKQPLIISMDNETDEEKRARCDAAAKKLSDGLQKLGITHKMANAAGEYKDANEALVKNSTAFKRRIDALKDFEDVERQQLEELQRESASSAMEGFLARIDESRKAPFYSTGFVGLDHILDGGLYPGLYIVGAISSLGKTTFCLQVADSIAQRGNDVLIFSLEMSRDELMSKSISRETAIVDLEENEGTFHAKTTRRILSGEWMSDSNAENQGVIIKAMQRYRKYAKNIYITEGMGNVGVEHIREKIQAHLKVTGKAPVVFIDYLQILAPSDIRGTDKQNTDRAVLELKRISRDFKIPVVGISSFNRENYTAPVNLASFKESGAIEYSSDVLIGLQYDGMDWEEGEGEAARNKRIRSLSKEMRAKGQKGEFQRIQIKVLKNRNGSKGDAYADFCPMFNYFKDATFNFDIDDEELLPDGWEH